MAANRLIWILLAFVMIYSGCGDDTDNGTEPTPTEFEISGPVNTSRTWSGTVRLTGDADILAGVHITIAAGTVFEGADSVVLQVHGNLSINGTVAKPIRMQAATGATNWGGIVVESGGVAQLHNVTGSNVVTLLTCKAGALACLIDGAVFSDLGQALDASSEVTIEKSTFENMGAMQIRTGSDVTITDSWIRGALGDLIVVNGGALTMSYCELGANVTTEHGNLYIMNAAGLNISYTNIIGAPYGMMIGGTSNAQVISNNFLNHQVDVDNLGSNTAIDMSFNYWDSGLPAGLGPEFTFNNTSPSPIATAGPRT